MNILKRCCKILNSENSNSYLYDSLVYSYTLARYKAYLWDAHVSLHRDNEQLFINHEKDIKYFKENLSKGLKIANKQKERK